jgi:hypothetical protein
MKMIPVDTFEEMWESLPLTHIDGKTYVALRAPGYFFLVSRVDNESLYPPYWTGAMSVMIYDNHKNLSLEEFQTSQHESILNVGDTLAQEHEVEDKIAERLIPEMVWEEIKWDLE